MPNGKRLLFKILIRILLEVLPWMSCTNPLCERLQRAGNDLKTRARCTTDASDMACAQELLKYLIDVPPSRHTAMRTKTAAAKNEVSAPLQNMSVVDR